MLLLLLLLLLLAFPAGGAFAADGDQAEPFAEEAGSDSFTPPSEEIVVTATRNRRALSDIPMSVTVISGEDVVQSPAKAVDDLLRTVPGINLPAASSLVSHPTSQSVSMRGLGQTRALVLLDGIPLNDGFGGWVNWTRVPYRSIERIEVVRGGSSSVYGTYAMGGVINVLTRPAEGRVLDAEGSYGTQNTGRANLYASETIGDTGFNLSFDYFGTDGYEVVPAAERGPIDGQANSEHFNLQLGADHRFNSDSSAFARLNLFRDERNLGTPLANNSRRSLDAAIGSTIGLGRGGDLQLSAFGEVQDFDNANVRVGAGRASETLALTQDIPTWDVGATAQWAKSLESWSSHMAAGVDFRHVDGKNRQLILSVPGVTSGWTEAGGAQQALGIFAEMSVRPLEPLEILGSLRFDYWRNIDAFNLDQSGATTLFPNRDAHEVSPRLSVRYDLGESWSLRGAVYRSFRAPTLNELYRGFFAGAVRFLPDPNLEPELLRIGGELGVDLRWWRVRASATGFWNELEDAIAFAQVMPFPNAVFQRQNFAETRSRGVELEAQVEIVSDVSLLTSYVLTEATIQSFRPDPSRVGNRVPNIPEHQFNFTLQYDNPRFFMLAFRGRYLSDRFANDRNTQELGSFFVLDISASRRIGDHWEAFLIVENLADEQYLASQTGQIGTLGAPRQVWGGVRLSY